MAIALGCNYSAPLKTLLSSGSLDVDWIKVSVRERLEAELTDSLRFKPVLLHVLARAGSRQLLHETITWDILARSAERAGSPHHAIHLALEDADWEGSLNLRHQTSSQRKRMMSIIKQGVSCASENSTVPILIENAPYYGFRGTAAMTVEPETFHEIVNDMHVGMLLDLAHVRVAANHLDLDEREYLHAMPIEHVREIHVAGPRMVPGQGMRDRHWEMLDEDFALLEHALEIAHPEIVTLEYGGTGEKFENEDRNSLPALEHQLKRIIQILGRA